MSEKFNIIMPETTDRELCVTIDKPVSAEGYKDNFLPRAQAMIEKHGEIRMLVYFRKYQGWEPEAATLDFASTPATAAKLRKWALVNPPPSMLLMATLTKPITQGEIKVFAENELPQAIDWIKAD